MIGRPVSTPVEAYGAGVRGWACAIPDATIHIISDSNGPNERAMESLPALAVEHLSITEAYRIGRTVHVIGYVLDQENQRIKTAQRVHRLLLDTSRQGQAAGKPHTAEHLTDTSSTRLRAVLRVAQLRTSQFRRSRLPTML